MTVLSGRYELGEKLGEGGMGIVYRARDTRLERDVAIKLLRPFVADDPDQRRRFDREARTLAQLSNDHIVRVYDYAESGADAYLVMEYVEGENLQQRTSGRTPIGWEEVRGFALPVCEALAYAHDKGVVHRDLTPANILIERSTGRVVATDFGLARIARSARSITATGVLIGTPEYWSPEQAMGRDNDGSTDMYALGCILFQLLTGHLPFEGEDRLAIGLRRAYEDAPSPQDVDAEAGAFVDSLLNRDASKRPSAAAAGTMLAYTTAASTASKASAPAPIDRMTPPDQAATKVLPENMKTEAAPHLLATRVQRSQAGPPKPLSKRRKLALALVAVGVVAAVAVVVAYSHGSHGAAKVPPVAPVTPAFMPNVIGTKLAAARQAINAAATKSPTIKVVRRYSTARATNVVLAQLPRAKSRLRRTVFLSISKGTPFAKVPSIPVGTSSAEARSRLLRAGFDSHIRFAPSWTTRLDTVISVTPAAGTTVRRPGNVTVLLSSGSPKTLVPDVRNLFLSSAESQLTAKYLHYAVTYVASEKWAPNQVLTQTPAPGSQVAQGRTVDLTITRASKWVKVFSDSGSDAYQSQPFTVKATWRIEYQVGPPDSLFVLTTFSWTPVSSKYNFARSGSFIANSPGALHVYNPADGAGTFRISINPSADSTWYFEIDDLE